jgi:hypothetical protein
MSRRRPKKRQETVTEKAWHRKNKLTRRCERRKRAGFWEARPKWDDRCKFC